MRDQTTIRANLLRPHLERGSRQKPIGMIVRNIVHLSFVLALTEALLSCAAPPSVSQMPPDMILESHKQKVILKSLRRASENLIDDTNSLLMRLRGYVGAPFQAQVVTMIAVLRQATKSGSEGEIKANAAELSDRFERLRDVDEKIRQTTYLPYDLGDMLSPSLMLQLTGEIQDLQRSIRSESWNAVQLKYDVIKRNVAPLRSYRDTLGNLARLGVTLGPALRSQLLGELEPLQQAMRGDSWDDVLAKWPLPASVSNLEYLLQCMEEGERHVATYVSSDRKAYFSALDELQAAMQGDSWERVVTKASMLRPREFFERYSTDASCVRVLSIDGGGIRGIIPAMVLAEIERRTDKPIAELFDLIVGTSTGGILALGLTQPDAEHPSKPAREAEALVRLYRKEGTKIFPEGPLKRVRKFFWSRYSPKGLEDVLKSYFNNTQLGDALTNVAIPAYEIETGNHFFFTTYKVQMHHLYMREVARAATAAPTYFPPFRVPIPVQYPQHEAKRYAALADGGLFANSPSTYALALANSFEYDARNRSRDGTHPLLLLSLGTGRVVSSHRFEDAWNWGLLQWAPFLVDTMFSDPGLEDEYDVFAQFGDQSFRLQALIPTAELSQLDNADKSNVGKLEEIANKMISEKAKEIALVVEALLRERPSDCKRLVGPHIDFTRPSEVNDFLQEGPYVP